LELVVLAETALAVPEAQALFRAMAYLLLLPEVAAAVVT